MLQAAFGAGGYTGGTVQGQSVPSTQQNTAREPCPVSCPGTVPESTDRDVSAPEEQLALGWAGGRRTPCTSAAAEALASGAP